MSRVFAKPALTHQQQIAHLKLCGMIIADDSRAEYWLRHVSYYRLSAYWLYFEHPKGQPGPRFRSGTSFDDVTALYDFDRNLRRMVMRGTEHVEVALRGSWAYQLAHLGGGHAYLRRPRRRPGSTTRSPWWLTSSIRSPPIQPGQRTLGRCLARTRRKILARWAFRQIGKSDRSGNREVSTWHRYNPRRSRRRSPARRAFAASSLVAYEPRLIVTSSTRIDAHHLPVLLLNETPRMPEVLCR
jgi:hypothetical protein